MKINTVSIIQAQCEKIIDIPSLQNLVIPPICTETFQGFIEIFPGVQAAYSLRRLSSKYTGHAIRVKRSSDNTFKNIGFTPEGNLDVDELMAFVGTGPTDNGFIHTLFDQSKLQDAPSPLDVQSASGNQPRIVVDGILQVSGNFASIFFDDSGDNILFATVSIDGPASSLSIFGVWKKLLLTNNPVNFNLAFPNVGDGGVTARAPAASGDVLWNPGNETTEQLATSTPTFNDLFQRVWTFIKTAGTNNQKIRRDSVQIAEKTQATTSTNINNVSVGKDADTGLSDHANMQFQELIIYYANPNSVAAMESNMFNYWISPNAGIALVQTGTLAAFVQTGTLKALVQTRVI